MTAIEHITTLSSAPWVMWMMLFLLVLFVVANIHQPKIMRTAWQMAFTQTDRVYNDAAIYGISSLELRLFSLLTASFSWTLIFYSGGAFEFVHYLLITACVLGWCLIRWGVRELISWLGKMKRFGFPKSFMMSLVLILTAGLFILNLGAVWTDNWLGWRIGMGVVVLVWLFDIFIRYYQSFVHNWKTFLGLIAYWLTVEIGSLIGLYFLIKVI